MPSIVAALALGLTACGSTDDKAAGTPGFWEAHAVTGASEVDPPTSVPAIAERSELVVLGSIEGAEEGKDYGEEGKPTNHTSNLTIKVERASSPDVSEAVVEFTRNPGSGLTDVVDDLPKGRYVFYLTSWYKGDDGPVYRCASAAKCLVGVTDGTLTTPREPEAAEDLAPPEESAGASKIAAADDDATLTLEDVYTISAAAVPSSDGGS
ncbi:hypothetical protein P1P68_22470 [Streptomyces scabiei]|uniref:hypothetical protein n=1 Tax=Streptomyces scabiei TaxID=1930 RepID=UPI0029904A08|nr:hypothetical protein [Streptomyces scabiei]MDW8807475.1 hypothetical protein [Streptomyces scabiei]